MRLALVSLVGSAVLVLCMYKSISPQTLPTHTPPNPARTLLEELGRELDEPLGVDRHDVAHVLLGREHQLVVEKPLGVLVEERRRRVDVLLGIAGVVW